MSEITSRLSTALADRYRLESHLGEGGMATVYLARDLKHDRKVAVKVLRPELAAILGGERFLNEIKVTANLQHPNILPLYDSGEADSFLYYVMPYVEGDTLRDKMAAEKQLGVEETIEIAKDVAAALHFAHERGIVHRDIKPENILLQEGKPLVADFGIALAVSQAGGSRLTETGLSLGTPHYMSPEQATGDRELDARSDVYSLGAMVYEMLVGEPPHHGNTVQAIVARILSDEPEPITKHRPSVPLHVDAALRKALDKTPADRFTSAAKFADALSNPAFTIPSTQATQVTAPTSTSPWNRLSVGLGAALVVVLAVALSGWLQPEPPQPVSRYSVLLPEGQQFAGFFARVALSPDGSRMVYSGRAEGGGQFQLLMRSRDQLQATRLVGTEGGLAPFFSPEGDRVGFLAGGLRVASLRGGPPILVTDSLVGGAGGSWGPDGFIYADGNGLTPLVRVRASGGAPEWFTRLDSARGETDHLFPDALPNGRGVLFTVGYNVGITRSDIAVADVATREHRVLVQGRLARYATSGHLVYVTFDGTLMAAPFDQAAMEITGEPTALVDGIAMRTINIPDLAVSRNGTLAYTIGGATATGGEPVWVGRDGTAEPVAPDWTDLVTTLALSPDGGRLAVSVAAASEVQVWIRDLGRGTMSKLTFQGQRNDRPEWTPDGQSVAYASDQQGDLDIYQRRADGTAAADVLLDLQPQLQEVRFSRDGLWLVHRQGGGPGSDLHALRLDGDSAVIPLVATEFQETAPALSPDGRWLAYVSNETGGSEVYVSPFPNVDDGRWLVSSDGGSEPVWAHSGSELFYRNGALDLISVQIVPSNVFIMGEQRALFSTRRYRTDVFHRMYDVSPDDQRFVMIQVGAEGEDDMELIVVENFFEELKERVGN